MDDLNRMVENCLMEGLGECTHLVFVYPQAQVSGSLELRSPSCLSDVFISRVLSPPYPFWQFHLSLIVFSRFLFIQVLQVVSILTSLTFLSH